MKLSTDALKFLGVIFLGAIAFFFCKPEALSSQAWLLFCTFVVTIVGIVLKPFPMGVITLVSITFLACSKTIPLTTVLKGFSNDLIWLILMACFLAKGLIHTGLGRRIAFYSIKVFGGSPLGISYGLLCSSATLSSVVPSATARTGGIVLPVLESLISVMGGTRKGNHIAVLLTMVTFHSSVISSALFVTANAGNPIAMKFAKDLGINVSWGLWLLAASVPVLVCIVLLPFLLQKILPACTDHDVEKANKHVHEELTRMGKITKKEKIALAVFALLLFLWSAGDFFHVHPTEAGMIGVALFLLTRIIQWKDVLAEDIAWDTFFWMASLIMMASELQALGVVNYFTDAVVNFMPASSPLLTLSLVTVIYFYSHYFFASTVAHLSAMYGPLLVVCLAQGAPPYLAAMLLAFTSSLFGGLTHYSSGPAPILFAQGHVDVKTWWKVGFYTSLFYIAVWGGVGALWWKIIGLY